MKVRPKRDGTADALVYGDYFGMKIFVSLKRNQIWTAKKYASYYVLSRKGSPCTLRVTDAVLGNHFEVVEEKK